MSVERRLAADDWGEDVTVVDFEARALSCEDARRSLAERLTGVRPIVANEVPASVKETQELEAIES